MNLHDLYEKPNHAAFCFGRMNPPTLGHGELLKKVAEEGGNNYFIVATKTHKLPDNPLPYLDKINFIKKLFPQYSNHVVEDPSLTTIMKTAAWVYNQGFRSVTFVAGSDRLSAFKELLDKYNGQGEPGQDGYYNFSVINYVSSGKRDPDAEGITGYSASKARTYAQEGNFKKFAEVTGAGELTQELYDAVRAAQSAPPVKKPTAKKPKVTKENVDIGREWMTDTEIDQYIPEPLQQEWRELLGYDENGNTSKYWAFKNEPDIYSDIGRVQILSAANLFFRMKKIPITAFDFKDIDDELEWLVQVGQRQDVAEGTLNEGVMDQLKRIYMMLVSDLPMGTPESEFLGHWQRIIKNELGKNIKIDTLAKLRNNFVNRYKSMGHRGDAMDWHREMGQDLGEGADDIAQAKERLAYLEKIFDTSYEYSDDHSVWKKHNAIRQEMDQLKKIISQGVAEGKEEDRVFYAVQDPNKSYHIYSITGNITDLDEFQGKFGRKLWIEGPLDDVDQAHRAVHIHKQRQGVAEGLDSIVAVIDGVRSTRTYNDKDHAHNSLSKLVSYGKAKVAELYINGEKVEHFELNKKYLDFEPKRLDSTMSEAGPFSYGAKKPRKGSVADLAAKKRQEQEKGKQPVEPRDQMVGVARIKKDVEEGFTDDLDDIYALHPGQKESESVAIKIVDVDLDEFDDRWTALPMPYLNEFGGDLPLWDMEDLKMYPHIIVQRMTFDQYVKLVSNYINSDDMTNSVLNKMKRGVAEDFGGRKFVKPNFDFEWEEAERYPEFVKLGKDAWIDLARKGQAVAITSAQGINNTDAGNPDSFKSLDPAKQKRALAQLEKGTVEMPILAVYSDGHKELIGGNTRLTAMMARDGQATVWAFRVPGKQGVSEGIKSKAAAAALTGAIASPQAHGISIPAFNMAPAVYQTQIKPKQDQEASRKAGRAFPLSQQSKELMKKKDVDETIRKVKGGYRLVSHKGKNLGTYPTHAGAERREQQVNYFKHVKEDVDSDNSIKYLFAQFLPLAAEYLGLEKLPKINLELILPAQNGQASFGGYNSNTKEITLAIANRHPVDIFRTLAHELVHFKQDSMGKLKEYSGETGSTEENQANTVSGIIMRLFNKAYPDAINAKVISTDSQDIEEDIVDDTVQYHDTLEPSVWQDGVLKPEIRNRLLTIAKKFIDSLNVDNFDAKDIVLTGSMANYNYTKFSDFDLHVITDYDSLECSKIANEFYQSKKRIWNRDYDIQINGHDVELYVEDDDDPPVSGGVYSILDNKWIKEPTHQTPDIDLRAVRAKTREYIKTIHDALNGHLDAEANARLVKKLRDMRTSGLERAGEFSVENLAYKTLRNAGILEKLSDLRKHTTTTDLSL